MSKPAGALNLVEHGNMVNPLGSLTDGLDGGIQLTGAKIGKKNGKTVRPVGSLADGLIGGIDLQGR